MTRAVEPKSFADCVAERRGMWELDAYAADVGKAVEAVVGALRAGGRVYFFGNGGSAAQAQHMAAELSGRFLLDRPAYAGLALTVDTSALTAIANDYGYDHVFARQLEGLVRPGDVAIGMTTSGESGQRRFRTTNRAGQRGDRHRVLRQRRGDGRARVGHRDRRPGGSLLESAGGAPRPRPHLVRAGRSCARRFVI